MMEQTLSWKPSLETGEQPLYVSIIKALAADIEAGELSSGTRLPTQRELADVLGVALGTVTKAYSEAERRGLIHSQGRRGTFVGLERTGTSLLSSLMDVGGQVIDLSKNHPTYADDPDLALALRQLSKRPDCQSLLEYGPSAGYLRHREAGARWFGLLGLDVHPDNVIVTSGGQHALTVILTAVATAGETILAEEYAYPGIKSTTEMLGLELLGVAMDNDGPLPESVRAVCRQRRVRALCCNPTLQNPVGYIMTEARRHEMAELAEEFDFMIIEDEILRPLVPDPPPFVSAYAPERSLAVLSASKLIAAGLRIGFIAAPPGLKPRLVDALRSTVLALPPLTAEIFTQWIDDGTAGQAVARRRDEFQERLKLAQNILEGFEYVATPYSCHVWLKLPPPWSTTEFAIQSQRRGVAVAPAELFAINSRQSTLSAARVSLGTCPTREVLARGLELVVSTLRSSPQEEAPSL